MMDIDDFIFAETEVIHSDCFLLCLMRKTIGDGYKHIKRRGNIFGGVAE